MTDVPGSLASALQDRYRIEREIGAGGMATVYLARDLRHDRPVALKLLNAELGAVLGIERFLAEIKVTANLQHPNLVPLFDSGEADGHLFYVMPFVEGESLRARLGREKQLPIEDALRIAVACANALDYAHGRGVIHRDLKPENILLQAGQPVVADFGIALAVTKAGGNRITQTGLSLGTPQYMSPEQATGDRVIDGRSDIYSLAAVTYEMLTGEPPHIANTAQAIIARVLTDKPRPVRNSRSAVPEHVEAAIDRALQKLPADRFATAREFAEALQGRGATLATVPLLRWSRSRRLALWVGVLGILAVGGYVLWLRGSGAARTRESGKPSRAETIRSLAVLPLVNVGGDSAQEYFADGITDELTTALAKLPGVRVAARSSAFTFKRQKGLDGREAGKRLGVRAVLEGSLRREGSRMRLNAQLTSVTDGLVLWSDGFEREVKDAFTVQTEVATAIAGALRITIGIQDSSRVFAISTTSPEVYDRYLLGKYFANQGTREGLERGLGLFQEVRSRDSLYARAYTGIALTYFWLADAYLPPKEAYPQMIEAATHAIRLDPNLAEAHAMLAGSKLLYEWDWEAARQETDRALALNPNESVARQTLMMYRLIHGDSTGALAAASEWVRSDPLSPITNHLAAWFMTLASAGDSAVAQARRAEAIAPGWVYDDSYSGYAYLTQGLYSQALDLLERGARTLGHPTPGLAMAYARTGRRADAERILRDLESRWGREYLIPERLAAAWATLGNYDRAFTWLERGNEAHSAVAPFIATSAEFAPMHKDPRFQRLLKKLNLAPR